MERNHENDYASWKIERATRGIVGKMGITRDDMPDLRQDIWNDLIERRAKFCPELGNIRAFINRIVNNKVASILKERSAAKRGAGIPNLSLDWESEDQEEDGDAVDLRERYSVDDYLRLTRGPGRSEEERLHLSLDLRRIIARLQPHEQVICLLLIDQDVSGTSSVIGIPRSTLRDLIKKLRVIATREGLGIYLK